MSDTTNVSEIRLDNQVQILPGKGFKFSRYNSTPKKTGKVGAIRGKITGWSFASRRRMREAMLWSKAPDGWHVIGFTLTVPGSVLPMEEAKTLWADFSREILRQGFAMIWRLEIQERGQLHWHGVAFLPPGCGEYFGIIWKNSIVDLGPDFHVDGKGNPHQVYNRMELKGARDHAVELVNDGNAQKAAWLRYLQDHASKTKQAQIAENCGRHWGIVGRKYLTKEEPENVRLSDDDFFALLRVASFWGRRRIKAQCVFGCKLSDRSKRGRRGSSVWFENFRVMDRAVAVLRGAGPRSSFLKWSAAMRESDLF